MVIIIISIIVCLLLYYYYYFSSPSLFLTTLNYPSTLILETNWKLIAQEIPQFDSTHLENYPLRPRDAWNNTTGQNLVTMLTSTWIQGWQGDHVWYNFPLVYHNKSIDQASILCPNTIALLGKLDVQIAGYSLLLPKSRLSPHTDMTGPSYGSIALNLLLTSTPSYLYIKNRSGTFTRKKHKTGKAILFDSTQEHYAVNCSKFNRVILYVDLSI